MTVKISCTNCGAPYPADHPAYKCEKCGGLFDFSEFPALQINQIDSDKPGIWQYQESFGLPGTVTPVSLGEGNTPLVWHETPFGRVGFKLEFLNPTGSHKDRGVSLMVSYLKALGVEEAVEDSSGNAGASFAAYAAAAGIRAKVYVPDYASGPKRTQIQAYGAEIIRILGARSDVSEAVREAADGGMVYASHAYMPQLLPGFATLAYELFEQLGQMPAAVITPVGQGSLLLGLAYGFRNLIQAGKGNRMPKLIGVQAMACAPIWAILSMGPTGMQWVTEGKTVAEGVRVRYPLWGDTVLKMVTESGGTVLAIEEDQIIQGRDQLAKSGFYVEATSAIIWDALRQIKELVPDLSNEGPVIAVLTGSGLKSQN